MPNDPKFDLIKALMAMDSYSRGYGAGISNLGEYGALGKWSILTTSTNEFAKNALAFGFYAIAYKNADTGEVIISYRGTDRNGSGIDEREGGSDLFNGYGLALGYTPSVQDALIGVEQVRLALQFYAAVDADTSGAITVTGHSLGGGGLAGYVSSMANSAGILFDNMPFGVAVRNSLTRQEISNETADAAIGLQRGYYVLGEFLAPIRAGAIQNIVTGTPLAGTLVEDIIGVDGAQLGADDVTP